MVNMFEPTQIKNMTLRNRFVRSATVDNGAESGYVSDQQVDFFSRLAQGGIGLIITGMACVHNSDHIRPVQNSLADDSRISGFKRLTDAVHHEGGAVAVQLSHLGRERGKFPPRNETDLAVGPSFIENDPYCEAKRYRAMTEAEIVEIIEAFGNAAGRAKEAGFDAVQIHGAHAFLLAQFLSPYTNHRDDRWGGSLENRLRIHAEIYKAIRQRVGADYPVLIKLGVQDGFSGGLTLSEGKETARYLAHLGFDALEISQGLRGDWFEGTEFRTGIDGPDREAYYREWCREIKKSVPVPVMMVGGLRSYKLIDEIIRNNEADYVSLCRPFIREPGFLNDWQSGNLHRPTCISCNGCILAMKEGGFLHCVLE